MTNIPNITPKGEGKWELRFRYTDRLTGKKKRHKQIVHGTQEQAVEELALARARRLLHGADPEQLRDTARVKEFVDPFLDARMTRGRGRHTRKRRPATLERDANHLDMHILPEIGEWQVAKITLQDLDNLVTCWTYKTIHYLNQGTGERRDTGKYYAQSTINGWIKVLKLLMKFACKRLRIPNPAEDLEPLPEERKKVEGFSIQEAIGVLDAAKEICPHMWCLFLLGMATSRRFGCVSSLRVEDITYGEPIPFYYSQNEGRLEEGDKTHKRHLFPSVPELEAAIQWHIRHLIATEHPGVHSGLLFPARVSDPSKAKYRGYMTRGCANGWIKRCAEKAGIKRPVSYHHLRHTCNTWLVGANVTGELIRAITGHESTEMTGHYAQHVSLDDRKGVVSPFIAQLVPPGYAVGTKQAGQGG